MDNINLTSNKTVKFCVMATDYMVVIVLALLTIKLSPKGVTRPNTFLVMVMVAMTLAQVGFSSIIHHHRVSVDKIIQRTTSMVFTFGILLFLMVSMYKWTVGIILSGKTVGVMALATYVLMLAIRMVEFLAMKVIRARGSNSKSIVMVGKEDRLEEMMRDLDQSATSGLRFSGYYAPQQNEALSEKMEYKGDYAMLEKRLDKEERIADEIYCALPLEQKELSKRLIRHSMHQATHFYYVPTFISDMGEYLSPSMIGEQVVFANFTEPLLDPTRRLMKRTFDVVCSGLALVCLAPFFPIVAIIIKCSSPGPVFFRQARTGLGGKDFMMLKFRSMHVNKDADKVQATKNDPRKFPFGDFMRRTSIDELPQLWNIFVGDMSIVGPRPHMRKHTEEYSTLIDDYMMRHYVKPGLTGWAQTTGFRGETEHLWQMEGRVKRDIWYIQNWTFWLDIRIILKTVKQVVWKDKQAY